MADYERLRQRNMTANQEILEKLGLGRHAKQKQQPSRKRRKSKEIPAGPTRRSARAAGKPVAAPSVYAPSDPAAEQEEKRLSIADEVALGYRGKDRRWVGERFGQVPTVPIGTVFGAGDYQRAGRAEMVTNGFFRPFVTPEWYDSQGGGCYALILNNDNGLSIDDGDTIQYAGSGGRRRGQNRGAQQSFHQDWKNQTNAALLANFKLQKPVRVLRGPKWKGKHGTGVDGGSGSGGYRYDGLYDVTEAKLMLPSGSRLKTAMFTLVRSK
eukprot:gene17444-35231_t